MAFINRAEEMDDEEYLFVAAIAMHAYITLGFNAISAARMGVESAKELLIQIKPKDREENNDGTE